MREHRADPARVYIAGLSAGGAAAAIVAAAYPDLFAAVGVHSGLPVGSAHDAASAFLAMQQGAPGGRPTVAMPTIIFAGDADTVVNPRNGRYVAARALVAFPRLKKLVKKGRSPGGRHFTRTVHSAENGKPFSEHWVVQGGGHAWAGGNPAGSFCDPAGPDASRAMVRFFFKHRTSQSSADLIPFRCQMNFASSLELIDATGTAQPDNMVGRHPAGRLYPRAAEAAGELPLLWSEQRTMFGVGEL